VETTLTGGYLYPRLGVMLGPFCEQMLGNVAADILIMGMGGITANGLSNSNTLIVGSERKMLEVSQKVIVVADHTKFGRNAMVHLAPLETADFIVTDNFLGSDYHTLLRAHNVEVILA
jgi:DeoR/GlpR family transcriptional regulator of sugar metabolism